MAGTKTGGQRAAATNKTRHGEDFYARIGRIGGMRSRTGGFHYTKNYPLDHPAHPSNAGRKGGRRSKRSKSTLNNDGGGV